MASIQLLIFKFIRQLVTMIYFILFMTIISNISVILETMAVYLRPYIVGKQNFFVIFITFPFSYIFFFIYIYIRYLAAI